MSPIRIEVKNRSFLSKEGQIRGFRLGDNLAILLKGKEQGGEYTIARRINDGESKVGKIVVLLNEELISGEKKITIKHSHEGRVDLTDLNIKVA